MNSTSTRSLTSAALLNASLLEPVNEFVVGGGKRIRGALTQLAYEIAGGRGEVAPSVSAAIEFLHAGSLVIDDFQDNSLSRRGKPTMHTQIGGPLAINAGNWMYFRALEILATAPFDCEIRLAMTTAMIQSARTCHEGQALDLAARVDQLAPHQWHQVAMQISAQKTGELVRLAMTLGGLSGSAPRTLIAAMDRFGIQVGVALQMRNDLDELALLTSNREEMRDDDLRNARVTWPWAWVATLDSPLAEAYSRRPIQSREQSVDVARALLPKIAEHGDAVINELLDRETRLLGEHVLELDAFGLLEKVLQPIRFNKLSVFHERESRDVCNR